MTVLLILISLLGFFLCYSTSKKATLNHNFLLEKIAQDNPEISKGIGVLLLLIAMGGSIWYWGIAAGIFGFFVILMTVGSTIILVAPLKYIGYKWVAGLFIIAFIVELIFN